MDGQCRSDGRVEDGAVETRVTGENGSREAVHAEVAELKRVESLLWAVIVLLACLFGSQVYLAGRFKPPSQVAPGVMGVPGVQEVRKVPLTVLDNEMRPNPMTLAAGEVEFVVTNRSGAECAVGVEGQSGSVDSIPPRATRTLRAVLGPGFFTLWLRNPAGKKVGESRVIVK